MTPKTVLCSMIDDAKDRAGDEAMAPPRIGGAPGGAFHRDDFGVIGAIVLPIPLSIKPPIRPSIRPCHA
jgi:hypothetical protein